MDLVAIDSTMLSAVGFDPDTGELEAVFVDGAVWRYRNVPQRVYRELLAAHSAGSYVRDFVIDVYPDYRVRRRT